MTNEIEKTFTLILISIRQHDKFRQSGSSCGAHFSLLLHHKSLGSFYKLLMDIKIKFITFPFLPTALRKLSIRPFPSLKKFEDGGRGGGELGITIWMKNTNLFIFGGIPLFLSLLCNQFHSKKNFLYSLDLSLPLSHSLSFAHIHKHTLAFTNKNGR